MIGKTVCSIVLIATLSVHTMERPLLNRQQLLDDLDLKKTLFHTTDEYLAYEQASQRYEECKTSETLALKEKAADLAAKTTQFKELNEAIEKNQKLLANKQKNLSSVEIFTETDFQKADALLLEIDKLCLIINQYKPQQKTNLTQTLEGQRLLMVTQHDENIIRECQKVTMTPQFQQYKKAKKYYQQNPTPDSQCIVNIYAKELHQTTAYLTWLYNAKDKIRAYQPSIDDLLLAIENSQEYIRYKIAKIDCAIMQLEGKTVSPLYEEELKTYKSNIKKTQQFQEWKKALQKMEHVIVPEENFNKMVAAQKEFYNTQEFLHYLDAYETYKENKSNQTFTLFENTYNKAIKTKQYRNLFVAQQETEKKIPCIYQHQLLT